MIAAKKKSIFVVIVFSPFILFGLGMFLFPCYLIIKSIQAKSWIPTPAAIELVDFHTDETTDAVQEKTFQYTYFIENKKYVGSKISFGLGRSEVENDYQLFNKLNEAKKIVVYVNPNNHSESVVVRGLAATYPGLLIGSFMWNSLVAIFVVPVFFENVKDENPLFIVDNDEDWDNSF
jgi:hypothetical protein